MPVASIPHLKNEGVFECAVRGLQVEVLPVLY